MGEKTNYISTIEDDTPILEAIVHVFEEAEIEYIFCLPGGNTSKLLPHLHGNKKIKPILVRHEQIASIMTEVYGRLTGKVGVFASQGAWALTNGTMGAIEGLLGSSPMLILTDFSDNAPYSHQAPYQIATGEYGGFDLKKALESVTKYTTAVYDKNQVVQSLQLALKHSLTGNPGPVSLIMHSNAIQGNIELEKSPQLYHTKKYIELQEKREQEDNIKEALTLLTEAKKPLIIAGSGVSKAEANEQLIELSSGLGIPVCTTAGGKGAIAEENDLALGIFGTWGQEIANKYVNEADVILIVGSRLTPSDTVFANKQLINPEKQTLIQIDIEEKHVNWTYPIDQTLIGDAKIIMNQMIKQFNEDYRFAQQSEKVTSKINEVLAEKESFNFMQNEKTISNSIPILPQRVVKEIEKVLDEKTKITLDSGENRVFMTNLLKTKAPKSIISPTASGAMGYAVPAALATKLVYPESDVIAVCGDGGFSMTMNGLLTAVQYDLKIIVVVMNNSALGWVKSNQGDRLVASIYDDIDFSEMFKSIGCDGIRVEKPEDIQAALQNAIESDKSTVIDIVTSSEEDYRKAQSQLMRNQ